MFSLHFILWYINCQVSNCLVHTAQQAFLIANCTPVINEQVMHTESCFTKYNFCYWTLLMQLKFRSEKSNF